MKHVSDIANIYGRIRFTSDTRMSKTICPSLVLIYFAHLFLKSIGGTEKSIPQIHTPKWWKLCLFIEIHTPIPINPYPWSIPRAYPAVTRESRCHRESLVRTWPGRNRSCPAGSVSSSNFRSPPWFPLLRITFQISVGQFWLRLISSSRHILTTTKRTKCEYS